MDEKQIRDAVSAFVHKYLDVHEEAEKVICDWALATWQKRPAHGLKYLLFTGSAGTGKSRAACVMEGICRDAFRLSFAASPVVVLETIEERYPCTPIFDDWNLQDENILTILRNGHHDDHYIHRLVGKEFKTYRVYGYKVITTAKPQALTPDILAYCIRVGLRGRERMSIPPVLDGDFRQERAAIQSALQEFHADIPDFML